MRDCIFPNCETKPQRCFYNTVLFCFVFLQAQSYFLCYQARVQPEFRNKIPNRNYISLIFFLSFRRKNSKVLIEENIWKHPAINLQQNFNTIIHNVISAIFQTKNSKINAACASANVAEIAHRKSALFSPFLFALYERGSFYQKR